MTDTDTGSPRKPRGRKPPPAADDWPEISADADPVETPPARQRVAKAMARAGLCSRRDAEAWILDGRVSVNGEKLTSPARDIGPDDLVEVDGAPLPTADKTRLFLFHKPRGLVTSDHDPEGRETIFDHLRRRWPQGPRVVTVGRLDINTEGLLLLTNDGGLARMLELPKTGWLRRYRVRANGETDQAQLDALAGGITIDGIDYAGIEAKLDRSQGANCWLTMGLREGKNREIKRVLEHLGLEVNRLIRLSFGPFQLLDLEEGAVEEVRTRVLKEQLGAALAAEAGVDFGATAAEPAQVTQSGKVAHAEKVNDKRSSGSDAARDRLARDKPRAQREDGARGGARSVAPSRGKRGGTGDPRPQQSRANEQRSGERVLRRRDAPSSEERSQPRRHVSSLRTSEAETARTGPRKRIERTDTRDRHDRSVAVERKVSARPAGVSPSADGKRARIARSGGRRQETSDAPRGERTIARPVLSSRDGERAQRARSSRSEAPERPRRDEARTAPVRTTRGSAGGDERREARPVRSSTGGDRPQRTRRDDGKVPARGSENGGQRREARPARSSTGGERPQRARREDGDRSKFEPRSERPGARLARRGDAGDRGAAPAGKPRGEGRRQGPDGDARRSAPRGAGAPAKRGDRGGEAAAGRTAGKGRPSGAASRKPNNRTPGGKPPRGGAPGRTRG